MYLLTATVLQCVGGECEQQLGSEECIAVATGQRLSDGK